MLDSICVARAVGVGDCAAVEVVAHQPTDIPVAVHTASGIGITDNATHVVNPRQPAGILSSASAAHVASSVGIADSAGIIMSHQPADIPTADYTAAHQPH